MNLLGNKTVLTALLAVLGVGLSVQTYYVSTLNERLDALESARTDSEDPRPPAAQDEAADDQIASGLSRSGTPDHPRQRRVWPADPFALLRDGSVFGPRWSGDALMPRSTSHFDPFDPFADLNLLEDLSLQTGLVDRGAHYELEIPLQSGDSEVEVSVDGNVLRVTASHDSGGARHDRGAVARSERHYGSFEQHVTLPRDADSSAVRTEEDGDVLRVILPKRA